jgi:type II secretory pathway predicted ATPase ExeA
MTFPGTLNTKVADNKLSFPLVAHMPFSDAWFGSYEILKLGRGAENFLDRLCRSVNNQVLRVEDAQNLMRVVYKFRRPLTQLSNAYSRIFSVTTAAVTTVLTQPRAEFSGSP